MKSSTWYFISTTECPLCGKGDRIRTRMTGEKPKEDYKRYSFTEVYDYCDV